MSTWVCGTDSNKLLRYLNLELIEVKPDMRQFLLHWFPFVPFIIISKNLCKTNIPRLLVSSVDIYWSLHLRGVHMGMIFLKSSKPVNPYWHIFKVLGGYYGHVLFPLSHLPLTLARGNISHILLLLLFHIHFLCFNDVKCKRKDVTNLRPVFLHWAFHLQGSTWLEDSKLMINTKVYNRLH